ncbi:MAG: carbohydrate binding family 9 domain-containing protein, partial [Melioribacteraceae bacterium]
MKKFHVLNWTLFILHLIFVYSLEAQEQLRPSKADKPPIIDGKLDDLIWQNALSVSEFKTFAPDFGKDGTEHTIAYAAYDSENLYFAFRCYDREPAKIKSSVSSRDNIISDDWVCINLDSFNDHQSLYAFYINPLGIQADSRFAAGQEDFSADFIWYSAGKLTPDGYNIEINIPLKSIRYAEGNHVTMSVFFERFISRFSEHDSFPELDPAKGMAFL